MRSTLLCCVVVMALTATGASPAEPDPVRFWILPFDNAAGDERLMVLSDAVPELLTVFFSQPPQYAVVERDHLDRILAEHELSMRGLVASSRRQRIGLLLGATTMITGSFARQGEDILITAHATDIQSGRVQSAGQVVGSEDRLAETLQKLQRALVDGLRHHLPDMSGGRAEPGALENLHCLRGLSSFYAAKYHQALAEFIECGRQTEQDDLPTLWRANCYLARDEHEHAFLELIRLKRSGTGSVSATEVERKLRRCLEHLPPDQIQAYTALAFCGRGRPEPGLVSPPLPQ